MMRQSSVRSGKLDVLGVRTPEYKGDKTMATWDDILTPRDKEVFALSGYGKRAGFGQRPAVLVIDVNYNFVGDNPEPILDSVKRFRNSCGAEGWEGVHRIRELLTEARKKDLQTF